MSHQNKSKDQLTQEIELLLEGRKLLQIYRKLPLEARMRALTFLSILDEVWNREVGDE